MPDMNNKNQPYLMLMEVLRTLEELDEQNKQPAYAQGFLDLPIIKYLPPVIRQWWAENKHFQPQIVVTSPTPMFYQFDYDVLL